MTLLLELGRALVVAAVLTALAMLISLTSPTPVAAPSTPPPAVVTNTEPAATTTIPVYIASTTPPAATSTPKTPVKKPTPPKTPPSSAPSVTLDQTIQTITNIANGTATTSLSLNDRVRAATVNILCSAEASGVDSISGSGVMVDPRGVILTNAHIGQFFLLHGYVDCVIRTGSPAQPKYRAQLLFLPPAWVSANAHKIVESDPTGNGEHDYAFLRITGPVSSAIAMPSSFPFLLIGLDAPQGGDSVLEAGYAAGFLGGINVEQNLYASSAYTKVGEEYTFGTSTPDLFSLGGTVVAQHGSSGGPVTDTDGVLRGIIVTTTEAADTANRDLRAIATSYIISDFATERGKSLQSFLSADLATEAEIFAQVFEPSEHQALILALEGK